jgi:3-dehydroquinate synthase
VSTATEIVHVALGERGYPIEIGAGVLGESPRFVKEVIAARGAQVSRVILITDDNVMEPHATPIADSLADAGLDVGALVIDAGEESKSAEVAEGLWEAMLERGADRRTIVVAVGGGVVGDLAGFVAATFARGLAFVQIQTTLLAQVDSSVGGKVGINLSRAKNMVGCFWQPHGVLIDIDTLATLPERDYRSGLAEVVKYGVILDAEFFAYLESHVAELAERDATVLTHVVARCCRLKADVVEKDEREETGLRAVLNYGHTFCHAIEALAGYGTYLHGEAVSIGMHCAAQLAEWLKRVPSDFTARQHALLTALELPVELPELGVDEMLEAMSHDKKAEHGQLRFVLPTRLGHVEVVKDVPREAVERVLREQGE